MATVTKTFSFAADAEGFVANPGANSTLSWDGSVGNPAGSLKARVTGRNKNDSNSWAWTGTWEQLGVPTGSTVSSIRVDSAYTRCTEYATGSSSTIGPYQVKDGGGSLLATLWSGRTITGTDASWVAVAAQADQTVPSAVQDSTSTISIVLADSLSTGASNAAAVSTYDDEVVLVITYSATGSGSSLPFLNDAETQTSGTTITAANSGGSNEEPFTAAQTSIGANMAATYDSANPAHGTNAFKIQQLTTTPSSAYLGWQLPAAVSRLQLAFYLYHTVTPTSSIRLVQFLSSGTVIGYVWGPESGSRIMDFRDASGASGFSTTTTALALSTFYRVEVDVTFGASGAGTLNVYTGDATTLLTSAAFTGKSFGTTCNQIRIGMTTPNYSATANAYILIDDIYVTTSGLPIGPGPYTRSGTATASGALTASLTPAVDASLSMFSAAAATAAVTPAAAGTRQTASAAAPTVTVTAAADGARTVAATAALTVTATPAANPTLTAAASAPMPVSLTPASTASLSVFASASAAVVATPAAAGARQTFSGAFPAFAVTASSAGSVTAVASATVPTTVSVSVSTGAVSGSATLTVTTQPAAAGLRETFSAAAAAAALTQTAAASVAASSAAHAALAVSTSSSSSRETSSTATATFTATPAAAAWLVETAAAAEPVTVTFAAAGTTAGANVVSGASTVTAAFSPAANSYTQAFSTADLAAVLSAAASATRTTHTSATAAATVTVTAAGSLLPPIIAADVTAADLSSASLTAADAVDAAAAADDDSAAQLRVSDIGDVTVVVSDRQPVTAR